QVRQRRAGRPVVAPRDGSVSPLRRAGGIAAPGRAVARRGDLPPRAARPAGLGPGPARRHADDREAVMSGETGAQPGAESELPVVEFSISGPLPTGTMLLEASAGTGKTWRIAALVTRYVAEGIVPLEEMLVVTFSRAASQELRARVREQLAEAEAVLAGRREPDEDNELLTLLLAVDPQERALRHARVRTAL